jgi:Tol biopolymer transport system component
VHGVEKAKPRLTAEMVVDGRVPRTPALSPDGRWVAFVISTLGQAGKCPLSELWIAATDGSAPTRRLTDGTALDSRPRWAQDSESIFFLSDRNERRTGRRESMGASGRG